MHAVSAWFAVHGADLIGLAIVVLPSLITGLRDYPRVQTVFSVVLDALSFVTHRDSPGSLKPLLTRSEPPPGA